MCHGLSILQSYYHPMCMYYVCRGFYWGFPIHLSFMVSQSAKLCACGVETWCAMETYHKLHLYLIIYVQMHFLYAKYHTMTS